MQPEDLQEVFKLSDRIHPDLPEDYAIQERRLMLWPDGCKVLRHNHAIMGYAFAHPILAGHPPSLNTAPFSIPDHADEFYLHDIVVDPALRGFGAASSCVKLLLDEASSFSTTALVSVYGTVPFWSRFGFEKITLEMNGKLAAYGADAIFMRRLNNAFK